MPAIKIQKQYKKYPAYKDSGVDWLGQIPESWSVAKIKRLAILEYGESLPDHSREDGPVCVYGSNGAVGEHNRANTVGETIIIGRKGSAGKIQFSNDSIFAIDTTFYIDHRKTKFSLKWLQYLLSILELDSLSMDSAVPGLSRDLVYSKIVPRPSVKEQKRIAEWLDEKAAIIDEVITKKKRLVELLKEKRSATIHQAITSGNSNIHSKRLKYVADINNRSLSENTKSDFSFKYVDIGSVDQNGIIGELEELTFENCPSRARRVVVDGSTIIGTVRTYLKAIHYFEKIDDPIIASTGFAVIDVGRELLPKYFYYHSRTESFIGEISKRSVGVSYPAINQSDLANIVIKFPEIREQENIVKSLEMKIGAINDTIGKVEASLNNFLIYKQSLIYNAVVGEIKI